MQVEPIKYLDKIDSPDDLKRLKTQELPVLCDELRQFIIREVSCNPGHFGASLGAVELAVALHYTYNTPYDKLVWDVGHQAYAHKILTGRRDTFATNRKLGGISGFPKMAESEYDAFGAGHASVSISAAAGIAEAAAMAGEDRKVVAVIGDGAMSGGLAYEGLNNAGGKAKNLLVILNDNRMSIDPNVGAMKEYLFKITKSAHYNRAKHRMWSALAGVPRIRAFFQKVAGGAKATFLHQSNIFESMGFRYFGPVDGHDVQTLVQTLHDLQKIEGNILLHVLTVKGKGYKPAEDNQTEWHAPGKFDPETGLKITKPLVEGPPKYQDVFGETLVELARENPKIVGITPAMPSGCSMNMLMEAMPDRAFDVGIAEGHAVTFSAGLASGGAMPFCNIYSSFAQRAYDNVIHDVALQGLDVVLCLDRGGLVGEDGATHHGVFDIASLRAVPDVTICSPMNEVELRNMMYTAQMGGKGAFVIRYPRGSGVMTDWRRPMEEIEVGKAKVLSEGTDVALLTFGPVGNEAAEAAREALGRGVSVFHADLRFVKPLDTELLDMVGQRFDRVVTVEDGVVCGGVGSAVIEYFCDKGYKAEVKRLGVPDRFVEHGTVAELKRICGFDKEGILAALIGK